MNRHMIVIAWINLYVFSSRAGETVRRRTGDLRAGIGVQGSSVGISLLEVFLLPLKCKLQIYVYRDTVIGFLILTNYCMVSFFIVSGQLVKGDVFVFFLVIPTFASQYRAVLGHQYKLKKLSFSNVVPTQLTLQPRSSSTLKCMHQFCTR